jgi:hypothetical protein
MSRPRPTHPPDPINTPARRPPADRRVDIRRPDLHPHRRNQVVPCWWQRPGPIVVASDNHRGRCARPQQAGGTCAVAARSDLYSRLLDVAHDGVSAVRTCHGMRLVERCERLRAAVLSGRDIGQPDHVGRHPAGPRPPDVAGMTPPAARAPRPADQPRAPRCPSAATPRIGSACRRSAPPAGRTAPGTEPQSSCHAG